MALPRPPTSREFCTKSKTGSRKIKIIHSWSRNNQTKAARLNSALFTGWIHKPAVFLLPTGLHQTQHHALFLHISSPGLREPSMKELPQIPAEGLAPCPMRRMCSQGGLCGEE